MKKIYGLWLMLIIVLPFVAPAQEQTGIKFESGLSWNDVLTKAKQENKFIFMDCYTTWCGPCKMMSQKIFPQKEVGNYFNEHFISVAVQFDRTSKDDSSIQAWYGSADSIHNTFHIHSYPTYLFFSPDGRAVHEVAGATNDPVRFIGFGIAALNSMEQNLVLLAEWPGHVNDSEYLFNTLKAVVEHGSIQDSLISDAYLKSVRDPFTKINMELFENLFRRGNGRIYDFYLNNVDGIDTAMGSGYAEETLFPILFHRETESLFQSSKPQKWVVISEQLKNKYPQFGQQLLEVGKEQFLNHIKDVILEQLNVLKTDTISAKDWATIHRKVKVVFPSDDVDLAFLKLQLQYYKHAGKSLEVARTADLLVNRYGSVLGYGQMNDIIFEDIFNMTNDPGILKRALKLMGASVLRTSDPENFDTYANLLYKTGKIKEGLIYENKAIELAEKGNARSGDIQQMKDNLEKMKKGQKTWNDDLAIRN